MQVLFLMLVSVLAPLDTIRLIHEILHVRNLHNSDKNAFKDFALGLRLYNAGPLCGQGIWKHHTTKEVLYVMSLSYIEIHFTAICVENSIVRTVTCYGTGNEHFKLVPEQLIFDKDAVEKPVLLEWVRIPEWCKFYREPNLIFCKLNKHEFNFLQA